MKVYIVTAGCYSDYTIEKVFLDEAKAMTYCKFYSNRYSTDDIRIEEFETADMSVIIPSNTYYAAKVQFYIQQNAFGDYVDIPIKLEIREIADIFEQVAKTIDLNLTYASTYLQNLQKKQVPTITVTINRCYSTKKFTEEEVTKKIKKIGYDVCAQIKDMIKDIPNLSHEEVHKMFLQVNDIFSNYVEEA